MYSSDKSRYSFNREKNIEVLRRAVLVFGRRRYSSVQVSVQVYYCSTGTGISTSRLMATEHGVDGTTTKILLIKSLNTDNSAN